MKKFILQLQKNSLQIFSSARVNDDNGQSEFFFNFTEALNV